MEDNWVTHGKYITIHCNKKHNFVVDNLLVYYDFECYKDVLFYVTAGLYDLDFCKDYDKIIIYNIEHLMYYSKNNTWNLFFDSLLNNNKLLEFWDFDIINYRALIYWHPKLITKYKFKPLRYIDKYKKVSHENKKFDAIQIGGTRYMCPYRNNILYKMSKIEGEFSFLSIDKSKYSLSELYDEINLAKVVINIPRIELSGQEQVRIGQLLSMNCTIATQTHLISHLSDFIYEVNFNDNNICDTIKNLPTKVNVYKEFKQKTESDEDYKEYIQQCCNKWYSRESSTYQPYIFTIAITTINSSTLKQTLNSIVGNSLFGKIQILILDISDSNEVELWFNENYGNTDNITYIKCEEKTISYSRNKAISCAIGKYVYFINSGQEIYYNFLSKALDFMNNNLNTNILIYPFLNGEESNIIELNFENLKIGPILQCCIFRRSCINDIRFQYVPCSDIIFTGVLCKYNKYEYVESTIPEVNISFINNENSESLFPRLVNKPDENWIVFTQNKIKEYYV